MSTTAQLAAPKDLGIWLPNITLSRTALVVTEGANAEDIERLEGWLEMVGGCSLFWWGDYLNHLRSSRGPEYAQVKAMTGYSPEALKAAAYVCRKVAPERRMETLTYGHHHEVAPLTPTEQELWLTKAEAEGWSTKMLRSEIRQQGADLARGSNQAPANQQAARAWDNFEVWAAWYQRESAGFGPEQLAEADQALAPFAADLYRRAGEAAILALLAEVRGEGGADRP